MQPPQPAPGDKGGGGGVSEAERERKDEMEGRRGEIRTSKSTTQRPIRFRDTDQLVQFGTTALVQLPKTLLAPVHERA